MDFHVNTNSFGRLLQGQCLINLQIDAWATSSICSGVGNVH